MPTTRMFLPAGPSNPILFPLGWLTRQFICLQIQKYRIELDSPPLSLVGSTNRKMMLIFFQINWISMGHSKLQSHGDLSGEFVRVNFVRKVLCSLWSLVGAVLLASLAIGAEAPEQDAINHLLQFVEISRCTFLRIGVAYNSKSAVKHIKQKYDYFKNRIRTAEDFIALAATKSELSGRPYFVLCEKAKEVPTATWLHEELQEYRKTRKDRSGGS